MVTWLLYLLVKRYQGSLSWRWKRAPVTGFVKQADSLRNIKDRKDSHMKFRHQGIAIGVIAVDDLQRGVNFAAIHFHIIQAILYQAIFGLQKNKKAYSYSQGLSQSNQISHS
ncbi:hypothetical protein FGO68_gene12502 [Halteria grandinella]|uniref:Uncharacterized protein n=1 Tax=Halteria grandinella TaxID=5974 RepID=A0A8J8P9W5_HALGN|nr:hypothetical protein FGO68_gene12502 [Halteria grandinella]